MGASIVIREPLIAVKCIRSCRYLFRQTLSTMHRLHLSQDFWLARQVSSIRFHCVWVDVIMTVSKPSKKQRGKLKSVTTKKEPAKTHVKFDDNGEKVVPKKRGRVAKTKDVDEKKEGGGKSDRSPDAIQQASYYLKQWQKRDEPKSDDELPWKFKVRFLVFLRREKLRMQRTCAYCRVMLCSVPRRNSSNSGFYSGCMKQTLCPSPCLLSC